MEAKENTVGERLKEVRKSLGLSQEQMGALGGVRKQCQCNYERGARSPDSVYLSAISKHGADVTYILMGGKPAGIAESSQTSEFGARLREVRGNRTMAEFVLPLSVGRTTLIRYESGERKPDVGFLLELFTHYPEVGVDWLLFGSTNINLTKFATLPPEERRLLMRYRSADSIGKTAIRATAELAQKGRS